MPPPKNPNDVRNLTVEQPSAPPPEVLKQEFKLDEGMFDNKPEEGRVIVQDASGQEKPADIIKPVAAEAEKKEESKKEEPKKEEAKVEDKKEEKKEEVSPLIKPPAGQKIEEKKEESKLIVPKERKERDLSGYTPEEQTVLRQMSNEAFEFTTKLMKSRDNTFLQHPDAYLLSPQYKELSENHTRAIKEGDYWQACLEQMDAGKPIKDLVGWDANGNPQFGQEFQPDKRLEELVRMSMNKAYGIAADAQSKLKELPNKFKNSVQEDLRAIQDERAKRFAWVGDPKYLDWTINMGEQGDIAIKDVRKTIIDLFPPYLRNNPATEVAADLFVALRIQDAELIAARNNKKMEETKKEEDKKTDPSSTVKPAKQGDPINGVREFSLEGMPSS